MALVSYSDSEDSEGEQQDATVSKSDQNRAQNAPPAKPSFQKVVNRSEPNKIKVTLPGSENQRSEATSTPVEPPAKRARIGGAFGGFNSFLPAPKNDGKTSASIAGGTRGSVLNKSNSGRVGGLGRGISLKTGSAPAFSRERPTEPESDGVDESQHRAAPVPKTPTASIVPKEETRVAAKSTMFRPLSVANKKKKKPPAAPKVKEGLSSPRSAEVTLAKVEPPPKKKVSLFSNAMEGSEPETLASSSAQPYEPLLEEDNAAELQDTDQVADIERTPNLNTGVQPNNLDDLATSLGLSAAERRQLFGRGGQPTDAQLAQFNLADEYASNRQEIEHQTAAPSHNPVRSIAPGKHSLQQLINSAQTQKDALEESFMSGKRNKKEAGSKYGW